METHEHVEEAPLGCPITVFGGELDRATTPEGLKHWRCETTSAFRCVVFPGASHFFINQMPEEYASHVAAALLGAPAQGWDASANAPY